MFYMQLTLRALPSNTLTCVTYGTLHNYNTDYTIQTHIQYL